MNPESILLVGQFAAGLLYGISGFHKTFNEARHARLCRTLSNLGFPCVHGFTSWWVAIWELVGGFGITLTPFLFLAWPGSPFVLGAEKLFAFALLVISGVAMATDGRLKVRNYMPMNLADRLCCWLYIPETLLAVLTLMVLLK